MGAPDNRESVIEHLEEALATDDRSEKDYHIRQALQILGIE